MGLAVSTLVSGADVGSSNPVGGAPYNVKLWKAKWSGAMVTTSSCNVQSGQGKYGHWHYIHKCHHGMIWLVFIFLLLLSKITLKALSDLAVSNTCLTCLGQDWRTIVGHHSYLPVRWQPLTEHESSVPAVVELGKEALHTASLLAPRRDWNNIHRNPLSILHDAVFQQLRR